MNQIRQFCADCGVTGESLFENFCQNCYWKLNKLASPKISEVHIPVCVECTSVKLASGWQKFPDEEEMKTAISHDTSKFLNLVRGNIVNIDNSIIDWDLPPISFVTEYSIEENSIDGFSPHLETIELVQYLDKGICKACTIKKSGARNVTVQLRAQSRDLTVQEKENFREIAEKSMKSSNPDLHTSYLSKIEDYHGGLDYIFGNTQVAENFLYELEKHIIGEREKNYKLVTEDKNGKRIYSITYLYRIPEFRIGDYVGKEKELFKVENVTSRGIHLISLRERSKSVFRSYQDLYLANELIQGYHKIILSEDPSSGSYLIMDVSTFENEEVLIENFPEKLPIGDEILFIEFHNDYFIDLK